MRNLASLAIALALLATAPTMAMADGAQVIKIATLAPDGSAWMRELRTAATEVQAGTQGRVNVKYYPGGVMGNDTVVLRKMRLGQLQGGVLTSSELSQVYPDAAVYSLPFLFDNWDAGGEGAHGVDPILAKGFRASGMHMLAASDVGFAYVLSDQAAEEPRRHGRRQAVDPAER